MGRHLTQAAPVPECDDHRCSGHSGKLAAHGWINAVTWGIIFPLVILLAHSLRRELSTWWFHLHRALATLGFILAIVGAASGGGLADDDYHSNNGGSAHKALGILAIVAAALQTVTSLIWRPLKAHRMRGLWDVGHHWLGRLAWLFAIAAMFTGIYIAAVGWGYHVAFAAAIVAFVLAMAFKDLVDICMGHKLKSVTMELAAQRKTNRKDSAVSQTTDVVASHTADKWTENAGGLYPYLKTKRGKVNQGKDNIHSSVQLPAPAGNPSSGVEMADTNRHTENSLRTDQANGVTLV